MAVHPRSSSTYGCKEIAARLGHCVDWLYRAGNLDALYAQGMPRPLPMPGHRRWAREAFEAWRAGFMRGCVPANDPVALAPAETIEEHRAELAEAYRRIA